MTTVGLTDRASRKRWGHAAVAPTGRLPRPTGVRKADASGVAGGDSPKTTKATVRAELEQARVFDAMLRAEVAELNDRVRFMEIRATRQAGGRIECNRTSADIVGLRAQIAELHHLREGLWRRFLGPAQPAHCGETRDLVARASEN